MELEASYGYSVQPWAPDMLSGNGIPLFLPQRQLAP